MKYSKMNVLAPSLLAALGITACGGGGGGGISYANYEVVVTNMTNAQALSPVAFVVHKTGFTAFTLGERAEHAIQVLAESGDNSNFLAAANGNAFVLNTSSSTGTLLPGTSETYRFQVASSEVSNLRLTALSMLTYTNDGFAGIDAYNINYMAVGQEIRIEATAYDAGTEANTETTTTMPGTNGEGYNGDRDDIVNFVHLHAGVVGNVDLGSSHLSPDYRFDNPVMEISIRRLN